MAAFLQLYDGLNLTGSSLQVTDSIPDLRQHKHHKLSGGNWNDETSSFDISAGTWEFYADVNYGGAKGGPLHGGQKGNCVDFQIPENWISSIKKISD